MLGRRLGDDFSTGKGISTTCKQFKTWKKRKVIVKCTILLAEQEAHLL